ncbi:coiled-coil domain-containing protein 137-like [Mustelus asterias]
MAKRRRGEDVDGRAPGQRWRTEQRNSEPKKYNMKPKNIDEQEIPYKVREIMRSREKMKKQKKKPEKPVKKPPSMGADPHRDIPVPKFKRRKHEPERAYIERMEKEAQHVMFMTKNQVARRPELDKEKEEKAGNVKLKSEKKKEFDRKRLEKFMRKKTERKEMKLEKEMFTDTVRFGEVVMRPPTLTAKPRKSQETDQPGQRQLLLKALIQRSEETQGSKQPTMSMARQRMMLEERERVIKAYRTLKKQKLETLAQIKNSTEKLKNPK